MSGKTKIKTWVDKETGWTMAETRDGAKVRILCTDAREPYPVVGIPMSGKCMPHRWRGDGLFYRYMPSELDLVTEPEPQEPKSCPFCGKDAEHHHSRKDLTACPDGDCPGGQAYVRIDRWNRRVSTGPTWEQIDEVRRRLQVENRESPTMVKFALSYLPTRPEDKR